MTLLNPVSDPVSPPAAQQTLAARYPVDIFCAEPAGNGAAHLITEFFDAANDVLGAARYDVTLRNLSEPLNDDPRAWRRRLSVFAGTIHDRWRITPDQQSRLARVLRLAPRTLLVGGAVFLLRDIGLHEAHAVAIHGNFAAAAAEEQLISIDRGAVTSQSGRVHSAVSGFAALPVMLDLLHSDHGPVLSRTVSDHLGLSAPKTPNASRVAQALLQRACGDPLIRSALQLMQAHIENPRHIRDLAVELGVSTRKLERRFQDCTGQSPLSAYRELRIERAHALVLQTGLGPAEIAAATGFGTRANLSHWLRKSFGLGPADLRRLAFQRQG